MVVLVTLDRRSGVSRLSLAQTYYVKRFQGTGSRVKFGLGISRYQRELRNLQYFARLGLDTPRLVAHGYESRAGLLQQAVLVTAEVTSTSRSMTSRPWHPSPLQENRRNRLRLGRKESDLIAMLVGPDFEHF